VSVNDEVYPRPLGPYVLLARVGRGGMGDVFLARHGMLTGFEKHCVLKTLRDDRAQDPQLLARFADEARVVVQLSHRNIAPVFDVGRVGDRLYVVLEHVVGRDLKSVVAARPLPLPLALHVVAEVLEALDYAHRFVDPRTGAPLGIVHRDVSPHNVLLGVDGDTKLIDFGIATTSADQRRAAPADTVLGKLAYMSPEQARAEVVDHRSDQLSAAIMLTELLIHERFHDGLSQEAVWQQSGIGSHRPQKLQTLDADLAAIIERALSPRPGDRFPSCAAFADALSTWANAHAAYASARDLRRFLADVCGDLAAEHRALLRSVDLVEAAPSPPNVVHAPRVDENEGLPPAMFEASAPRPPGSAPLPPGSDDGAQFESIATTLALPTHTPAFGSIASTVIAERRPSPAPSPPPRVAPPSRHVGRLAVAVALGLALGVSVGLSLARAGGGGDVVIAAAEAPPPPPPAPLLPPEPMPAPPPAPAPSDPPSPAPPPAAPPEPPPAAPPRPPPPAATTTTNPDKRQPPPPIATPDPDRPRKPPPPPPPPKPAQDLDDEAKRSLTALRGCVDKVPCAKGVLEWSERTLSPNERSELRDAAASCAKRCRLR